MPPRYRNIILAARLTVLACAALLVGAGSAGTFQSHSFVGSRGYQHLQFWICIVFLADLVLEMFLSDKPRHYLLRHIPMFAICIPYVSVLHALHVYPGEEWTFLLGLIPVIRAVSVLATLLISLNFSRFKSLFGAYLILLAIILYFSSLMFYTAEYGINPQVHSFRSAIYWAVMSMTTTGSQITEYTTVGEAAAAVLAATGLILFPVFTVYVSGFIGAGMKQGKAGDGGGQGKSGS